MTRKQSYRNDAACVLECVRQAKRDAAFHPWRSASGTPVRQNAGDLKSEISNFKSTVHTKPLNERESRLPLAPATRVCGGEGWGEGAGILTRINNTIPFQRSLPYHANLTRPYPKSTLSLAAEPLIWVDNAFSEHHSSHSEPLFLPIKTQKTSGSNQIRPKNKPVAATPESRPAGRKRTCPPKPWRRRVKPTKGN
jgi:hypothetical protein